MSEGVGSGRSASEPLRVRKSEKGSGRDRD